jgi:flagellar motility protein MotE (MotC chaperone)
MKTFRIVAITIILSGAVFITGSAVYGALLFNSGASAGDTAPKQQVIRQAQPAQTSSTSMNAVYQQEQAVARPVLMESSSVQILQKKQRSDLQRIEDLEARVSALEARVK